MLTRARSRSTDVDSESPSASQSQGSSQADSAPQEDYVPKKKRGCSLKRKRPTHVSQWMCILPKDVENQFDTSFTSLKDPKTECTKQYLLRKRRELSETNVRCELYEVVKFNDGPRSWFIDNTIQTDGSLYMCTPVDSLFLALPYLITAAKTGKFTTLDTILEDETTHSSRVLEECVSPEQWRHVADVKELSSGLKVYKYSWDKTRVWLKTKVEALSCSLERQGVYVGTGSMSASLVRSSKQANISKDDYLRYAFGVVSDYLPKALTDQLSTDYPSALDSSQLPNKHKREADSNGHSEANGAPPTKKGKSETSNGEPLDDYSKFNTKIPESKQAAAPLTPAQKSLAKVDKTGMKSISSFFAAKNKKK